MYDAHRERLLKEVQKLKEMLKDREAALPAHSVRPHQIQEIEALEEKIAAMEKDLQQMSEE